MASGVLIIDNHPVVRDGLRRVLEQDPAFIVLGEAETGREAIRQAHRLRPNVVLIGLILPDRKGIVQMNAAGHTLLARTEPPNAAALPLGERLGAAVVIDVEGQRLSDGQ